MLSGNFAPGARAYLRSVSAALGQPPLWCTLLVCAAILILRRPDLIHTPQFWAEDGIIFFEQSHTLHWKALFEPYAGYLHLVPRLIAAAAAAFHPLYAPAIFVASAFLLTLYVASQTQSRRCPLPRHPGFALAVVLVPDTSEVLLFLVNVQWVLAAGLLLLLISADAQRPREAFHDSIAAVLLGLTGPFSVLLAPLFLWRAWRRRTRASRFLAALVIGCALVQGWTIWTQAVVMAGDKVVPEALLAVPGMRIGASLLAGGADPLDLGLALRSGLGIATLLGLAVLAGRSGPARVERVWLVLGAGAVLLSSLYRCRYVLPDLANAGYGSRYFFPLQLTAMWLVLATAWDERRALAWFALATALWSVAVNAPRLRESALPDLEWSEYAGKIARGESVSIPIHPAPWTINLPGGSGGSSPHSALVNVSARCRVDPDQPAMVGFVIDAAGPRSLLMRIAGPSLARFGIQGHLTRPIARLLQDGIEQPAFVPRRNGRDDPAIERATESCGAFAFEPGAADLASLLELTPGAYTLLVSSEDGEAGEVLVEIFDLARLSSPRR